MEDFQIDVDDEIFFGLPEDDGNHIDLDFIWEDTTTTQDAEPSTSRGQPKPSTSRGQKGAKKSSGLRLQCPHCPKTYANDRTLKTHLNSVRLKAMACRAPNVMSLTAAMRDLCLEALSELKSKFTLGDLAVNCAQYSQRLVTIFHTYDPDEISIFSFLGAEMSAVFSLSDVVLLSSLRMRVTQETNKLLNDEEFRSTLKEELEKIATFGAQVGFNFFVGTFILELSNRVLLFACREILNTEAPYAGPKKRSKDNFASLRFCKLVHYIGGSVVAGVKRRRRSYPSAIRINTFATIMLSTFVENEEDPSSLCDAEVKQWTATQDRGGLSYISKDAFSFFHKLISFVMCFEEEDGSLLIDKVNNAVSGNYEIIQLWDVLVGTFMEEDKSLEWFTSIVEVVCRCVSRGIIKRRLNEALRKPTANVAHRPKLAR